MSGGNYPQDSLLKELLGGAPLMDGNTNANNNMNPNQNQMLMNAFMMQQQMQSGGQLHAPQHMHQPQQQHAQHPMQMTQQPQQQRFGHMPMHPNQPNAGMGMGMGNPNVVGNVGLGGGNMVAAGGGGVPNMNLVGAAAGGNNQFMNNQSNYAQTAAYISQQQANSRSKGRKFTPDEIKVVQNLIERCLRLYMSQSEAITALHIHASIEPGFISLVWQKLEEQNPEFFKAYNIRLKIKEQISAFNFLVSQQANLMQKAGAFVTDPAQVAIPQQQQGPGGMSMPHQHFNQPQQSPATPPLQQQGQPSQYSAQPGMAPHQMSRPMQMPQQAPQHQQQQPGQYINDNYAQLLQKQRAQQQMSQQFQQQPQMNPQAFHQNMQQPPPQQQQQFGNMPNGTPDLGHQNYLAQQLQRQQVLQQQQMQHMQQMQRQQQQQQGQKPQNIMSPTPQTPQQSQHPMMSHQAANLKQPGSIGDGTTAAGPATNGSANANSGMSPSPFDGPALYTPYSESNFENDEFSSDENFTPDPYLFSNFDDDNNTQENKELDTNQFFENGN